MSRGTISERNYFLEKITLFHHSDLEHTKKFNSMRRSFTNVASGSFYVFRGKFSGKQVVLEKHTNPHQFWSLKQNLIWTSQKILNAMSTLTFTCRVGRSSRKKFTIVFETFWVFWIVAGVWRRKIETFCENATAGLPKPHFTCPEERFSGKQNVFLGKLFSFQVLIVKEKIMTPAKIFSEGCLKSTLRVQLIAFTIKFFLEIFLLLHLFRTSSGKNFNFRHIFFQGC